MKKKVIYVVTGTRAEYHLLYPLLKKIQEDEELNLFLAVTGAHLSEKYGNTYREIEKDGIEIGDKIQILKESDSVSDINMAIGEAIKGFDESLSRVRPDMMVVLGDRYELIAATIVAMNNLVPIAHIHGGETTEGAIDECIRHAITKMSYLHFTSCETYRKRVIQLGEAPDRVFNVGALGVENIKNQKLLTLEELEESVNFCLKERFAICTFHPVTLEKSSAERQIVQVLDALEQFEDMKIIFTKANADSGGLVINEKLEQYREMHKSQCIVVPSLGLVRYLSALKYASIVVGNSSSGIIETPAFSVPTINIGDRQKGRIMAKNIICCEPKKEAIVESIKQGLSKGFVESLRLIENPYGDGNTSDKIITQIKKFLNCNQIELKKKFYDIDFGD